MLETFLTRYRCVCWQHPPELFVCCAPGLLVHMLLLMLVAMESSGSWQYLFVNTGTPTVSSSVLAGCGSGGSQAGTRPAAVSFCKYCSWILHSIVQGSCLEMLLPPVELCLLALICLTPLTFSLSLWSQISAGPSGCPCKSSQPLLLAVQQAGCEAALQGYGCFLCCCPCNVMGPTTS